VESFSLEIQEEEESFDLALLASLEIDIIPHLGQPRVSANLITRLSKVLQEGSKLHNFAPNGRNQKIEARTEDSDTNSFELPLREDRDYSLGITNGGVTAPRERFSYWCFDLLFLICSDVAKGKSSNTLNCSKTY
jgi:hypothetical protein